MKTADSVEQQEERKAARGDKDLSPANTRHAREKLPRRDPIRIAAWKWQPGRSGNPSGRPQRDLAAEIARAVFENNHGARYKAFTKALLRGNAYCYKELADRGYGRLKEHVQHEIRPYQDASDEEIRKRIAEVEQKLGYSTPEVLPPADDSKPN